MKNIKTKRVRALMEYRSLMLNESKKSVEASTNSEFRELIEEVTNDKLNLINEWINELSLKIDISEFNEYSDEARHWDGTVHTI
jgi:hypothetical protein